MSVANTNNRNGFSLIELMVVITIVGILSAVSVSTYRSYAAKARIVSIINVLQSWQQKAIEYANLHGHFPNSTELNLAVPSSVSQYVTSISNDGGDSCGAMGWVGFTLNPATIGISNPDITDVGIYLMHYHTADNKIGSLCSIIQLGTGHTYVNQEGIFPDSCINQYDSAGSNPVWTAKAAELNSIKACM